MTRHRAYIGMGSNLGDRERTLAEAFESLAALTGTRVAARSSIYVTMPVDPSGEQQDYYNAVAALDTALDPHPLLDALQQIEARAGRLRQPGLRNVARTLDLDILLYDQLELDEAGLHVPHPRLTDRAFALAPLAEIAPDCVVPGAGPLGPLLAHVADQRIARLAGSSASGQSPQLARPA